MTIALTLNIADIRAAAAPTALAIPSRAAIDWAGAYPEERSARLAPVWRVLVIGTGALAAWTMVGGLVLVARGLGGI